MNAFTERAEWALAHFSLHHFASLPLSFLSFVLPLSLPLPLSGYFFLGVIFEASLEPLGAFLGSLRASSGGSGGVPGGSRGGSRGVSGGVLGAFWGVLKIS